MEKCLNYIPMPEHYGEYSMISLEVLKQLLEVERRSKALEQEVIRLRSEMQDYD
jgi:hypothetical protein